MTLTLPSQLHQKLVELAEIANATPEELGLELLTDIVDAVRADTTLLGNAYDKEN